MLLPAIIFKQKNAGICHVIYMEKLAQRRTGSPKLYLREVIHLRIMELPNHCGHYMGT